MYFWLLRLRRVYLEKRRRVVDSNTAERLLRERARRTYLPTFRRPFRRRVCFHHTCLPIVFLLVIIIPLRLINPSIFGCQIRKITRPIRSMSDTIVAPSGSTFKQTDSMMEDGWNRALVCVRRLKVSSSCRSSELNGSRADEADFDVTAAARSRAEGGIWLFQSSIFTKINLEREKER